MNIEFNQEYPTINGNPAAILIVDPDYTCAEIEGDKEGYMKFNNSQSGTPNGPDVVIVDNYPTWLVIGDAVNEDEEEETNVYINTYQLLRGDGNTTVDMTTININDNYETIKHIVNFRGETLHGLAYEMVKGGITKGKYRIINYPEFYRVDCIPSSNVYYHKQTHSLNVKGGKETLDEARRIINAQYHNCEDYAIFNPSTLEMEYIDEPIGFVGDYSEELDDMYDARRQPRVRFSEIVDFDEIPF